MAQALVEWNADLELLGFTLAPGARGVLVTSTGLRTRLRSRVAKARTADKAALKAAYDRLMAQLEGNPPTAVEGAIEPPATPPEPPKPAVEPVAVPPAEPVPGKGVEGQGGSVSPAWQAELDNQAKREARRRGPLPAAPRSIAAPPAAKRTLLGRVTAALSRKVSD